MLVKKYYDGLQVHRIISEEVKDYDTIMKILKRFADEPSAQPQRGRWIHHPEIGWGETWLCDQCGEKTTSTVMGKPRANFCPNCGADMRGEKNETD